jgi:hypothetical protein
MHNKLISIAVTVQLVLKGWGGGWTQQHTHNKASMPQTETVHKLIFDSSKKIQSLVLNNTKAA